MNRTRTTPCPVCGGIATDKRWYDFQDKWVWTKTEIRCEGCLYVFESSIFDGPYTVEGIGHVTLEREAFAADDRDPEKVIDRVIRQHIRRLAVLAEGKELVKTDGFKAFMNGMAFANANKNHVRRKHLAFLIENKDKFPENHKHFAMLMESLAKFGGKN